MNLRDFRMAESDSEVMGMSKNIGLCMTCRNASTCTYPRNGERPVVHCEDFCAFEPSVKEITPQSILSSKTWQAAPAEGEKTGRALKGLCVNCEERRFCERPSTESGVWHCENYR